VIQYALGARLADTEPWLSVNVWPPFVDT
jgi:hypothetical protein